MIGAYIALVLLGAVWGFIITKIINATNFRKLWKMLTIRKSRLVEGEAEANDR